MTGATLDQLSPVEKLRGEHDAGPFDCGKEELNRFLDRFALANQRANGARTYITTRGGAVVGYYSLAVGAARHNVVPARVAKGLARHPIPIMILARLAVGLRKHGRGIGKALLKDGLKRTAQAADIAGIRALFVSAKDDDARAFHEQFNFAPLLLRPLSPSPGHERLEEAYTMSRGAFPPEVRKVCVVNNVPNTLQEEG